MNTLPSSCFRSCDSWQDGVANRIVLAPRWNNHKNDREQANEFYFIQAFFERSPLASPSLQQCVMLSPSHTAHYRCQEGSFAL